MTSLERVMAAIRGESFDRYPVVNPYPFWYMMPHWPEVLGLTFLHAWHGSDDERLGCQAALHEVLGLDWMPVLSGKLDLDRDCAIETEDGVPVLVNLETGERTRYEELPKDVGITEPRVSSVTEVEAWPEPVTAEAMLSGHGFDITRKVVDQFGHKVFLFGTAEGPFAACFRNLTFEGLYDAVLNNPAILHAIAERHVDSTLEHARACAKLGLHGYRVNEYPAGAELLSEEHYLEFVFPYNKRLFAGIKEAGLVTIIEYLGWVEPRLPHFAGLDIDCLQTESSMKNYRNDVAQYRAVLGEEVCILGNSPILQVIEQGDEEAWRADVLKQARGIGDQHRYMVCAGSPTTWATKPARLRQFGEYIRDALGELAPPNQA